MLNWHVREIRWRDSLVASPANVEVDNLEMDREAAGEEDREGL